MSVEPQGSVARYGWDMAVEPLGCIHDGFWLVVSYKVFNDFHILGYLYYYNYGL